MKTLPLLLLAAAALLSTALPSPAQQMNYQGRLTDASGNPFADGQYSIQFSLWDVATGGTNNANRVWGPFTLDGTVGNGKGPLADIVNGRFNAVLGPVDETNRPLASAFGNTPRYLQIKVGTSAAISPRQAILDTPTAMMAQRIPNVWTSGANVGINNQAPGAPLQVASNSSGAPSANGLVVYNSTNTAGNHSIISARVAGSAGGNPFVSWDVNGEIGYSMGIDNADNKLKIAGAWDNVAATTRMTIDTIGNVGIGTTTPSSKLEVAGDINLAAAAVLQSTGRLHIQSRAGEPLYLNPFNTGTGVIVGGGGGSGNLDVSGRALVSGQLIVNGGFNITGNGLFTGDIAHRAAGGQPLNIQSADGSSMVIIQGNNSGNGLFCYGVAAKPGGGSWSSFSDLRLKNNVKDLAGALDRLAHLRSVTFDYKDPARFGAKGRQTGFIAQEVEQVFPEWISETSIPGQSTPDGSASPKYKMINITGFESLTVQALRELRAEKDAQIKTLTEENAVLRDSLKAQEAGMKAQESRLAQLEKAVTALAAVEGGKPAKTTASR